MTNTIDDLLTSLKASMFMVFDFEIISDNY